MQRIVLVETRDFVAIVEKPVKDQWMNSEKSSVWDSLSKVTSFLSRMGGQQIDLEEN